MLETAVDAIILIDQHGTIHSFNRAAEKMFGYDRNEVLAKNVSLLMPEPYAGKHDQYIESYLSTGVAKIIGIGREAVGRRKDGSTFPIELAVSETAAGENRTFTGVVRDITDRKQLEADVLDVSEREQQRIGHELHDGLCQELAGIGFGMRAIQQKAMAGGEIGSDEISKVTALLQDAIRHARELSHGLYPVDPQPNGLEVALAELAAVTSDLSGVRCIFDSANSVEVRQPAVATHLYRIAQEAVREAVRRGGADRIVITLAANRRTILLTVLDDGLGLCADGRYRHGMVLRMIQHRARVIGANFQLLDGPGAKGVRLVCELPMPS